MVHMEKVLPIINSVEINASQNLEKPVHQLKYTYTTCCLLCHNRGDKYHQFPITIWEWRIQSGLKKDKPDE